MNYEFPIIKTLDDLLPAIKGRNEFVVAERDWGFVVNYNVAFEDTFGDGKSITSALRRECRGIKFGLNGKLISRPYHKFFNLNEREETQSHNVNFNNPFMILDKLDGSMLHPMMPDGTAGDIVWCTKMGPTDIAQAAALRIPNWLNNWVRDCISEGHTPI